MTPINKISLFVKSPDSLQKVERVTEMPLMVMSFAMIPILTGLYLWDLSPVEERLYTVLEIGIWACFAVIFAFKFILAPSKRAYLRHNWLDALLVILPVIRPLRIIRAFVWIARDVSRMNRLVTIESLVSYGIGIILVAATIVTTVEQNAPDARIHTFPDALYWSLVTVSTVGYGDFYPVTVIGKVVAVTLMLSGIGIFGGIVAKIVAAFDNSE